MPHLLSPTIQKISGITCQSRHRPRARSRHSVDPCQSASDWPASKIGPFPVGEKAMPTTPHVRWNAPAHPGLARVQRSVTLFQANSPYAKGGHGRLCSTFFAHFRQPISFGRKQSDETRLPFFEIQHASSVARTSVRRAAASLAAAPSRSIRRAPGARPASIAARTRVGERTL